MRHWVSAALACSVAAGAFVSGAQQAPVFRSGADVIEVIAYAADRRGTSIRSGAAMCGDRQSDSSTSMSSLVIPLPS